MTTPTNAGDDDLRRLLHDAVADVQPHGTYDDVRSRTAEEIPMKRWFLPTIAVAAVMAAVVSGGAWLLGDGGLKLAPSGTPSAGTSAPSDQATNGAGDDKQERAVPVYYVGETAHGKKLFREFHRTEVVTGLVDQVARAAAAEALGGDPADADYSNPWPRGATTRWGFTYEPDRNLITISLPAGVHDRPSGMSEADAGLAVQQLIYSVQAGLGKGRVPVQLLIDDKHTDTVLGVPASEPLAADNPDDVLAPVQVDNPSDGATVSSPFTVTGRANAFEANVVWELKQGDTVVKHGYATAQECCTLAPYSFQVTAPPGSYTLVVHDTDESGEGHPVDEDTKSITVQ